MKMQNVLVAAPVRAATFGGIAYAYYRYRSLPNSSNINASVNFDRFLSIANLFITTFLALVGLYVAYKSLLISEIAFKQSQESGPKTDQILTRSRDALEASVSILEKQQKSNEKTIESLNAINESSKRQQELLNKSLLVYNSQRDIQITSGMNKLNTAITNIFHSITKRGLELNKYSRPTRVEWAQELLILFEGELTNPALVQDKEALAYWKQAIILLRATIGMQSADSKSTMTIGNDNVDDSITSHFTMVAKAVSAVNWFALYKIIQQFPEGVESIRSQLPGLN